MLLVLKQNLTGTEIEFHYNLCTYNNFFQLKYLKEITKLVREAKS